MLINKTTVERWTGVNLRKEFLQEPESCTVERGMSYLCSRAAGVSMPRDVVHFTSLAFGLSPHSTVPFSSGEAICNNTSGIETMERGRERERGNPHCRFL